MRHFLNIGHTDGADAVYRARLLFYLNQAVRMVYDTPFVWTFALSGNVSLSASAGVGDMPADFGNISPQTKVYVSGQKWQLTYRIPRLFFADVEYNSTPVSLPDFYTIAGMNTTTYRQQIHVWRLNDASMTLHIRNYQLVPPVLTDAGGVDDDPALDATLQMIPAQYHHTILFDYVCKRVEREKGGFRVQELDAEFKGALRAAWMKENPSQLQGGEPTVPSYGDSEEVGAVSWHWI